jgi:hypothetical protein
MQQRTLQIDSSTNSSMVVQVMEKVSPWFVGRVGENPFFGVVDPSEAHAIV